MSDDFMAYAAVADKSDRCHRVFEYRLMTTLENHLSEYGVRLFCHLGFIACTAGLFNEVEGIKVYCQNLYTRF
jgi:hypothetical protein